MSNLLRTSLFGLLAAAPLAQAAPTTRYQDTLRGELLIVGNTLAQDCGSGVPAPLSGTVGACGTNTADTAPDVFWRADQPTPGLATADTTITVAQARSTAMLALPPGATVERAFLYWAAKAGAPFPSVTFEMPGVMTQTVTPTDVASVTLGSTVYRGFADVTSLVASTGPGPYRVGGVAMNGLANANDATAVAGWWLVVVVRSPVLPNQHVWIADGLDLVLDGSPVTANSPPVDVAAGPSRLVVVALDGDLNSTGESLVVNGAPVSDALNAADDVFNGTRSRGGLRQ